jgi:hypothetical protein
MKLYLEAELQKQADPPTLAMLDLWHKLVKERTKADFEVLIGNRREHKELNSFKGELYTAYPQIVNEHPCLVLWLDNMTKVDSIFVTHELGHWVLKLQGFQGIRHIKQQDIDIEALLGSMCHHPPLYALQRQCGHEPQEEIDDRTESNIKQVMATSTSGGLNDIFLFADDLLNCSEKYSTQLRSILMQKHKSVWASVDAILSLATDYDILNPRENLQFLRQVIKRLKLGNDWYEPDEVQALVNMTIKVTGAG